MYYLESLKVVDKDTMIFLLIILFANILAAILTITLLFLKQRKFSNALALNTVAALVGYILWYTYPNWM